MAKENSSQRERLQQEKEYQAALQMSASMQNAINKSLAEQAKNTKDMSDKTKEYVKGLASSMSSLQTSEDISKKIADNEQEMLSVSKQFFGKNAEIGKQRIAALKLANEGLKIEESRLLLTEKADAKGKAFAESIANSLDSVSSKLSSIPLFGDMLSKQAQKATDNIRGKLSKASEQFTTKFKEGLDKGKGSMGALSGALPGLGKSLLSTFLSPSFLILGIVAALGAGLYAMNEMGKASVAFRKESGMMAGQFKGLESNVNAAAGSVFGMTGDMEEGARLAAEMYKSFDGVENISGAVLTNAVRLGAGLGLSVENIGNVNKLFQNTFGASQELAQSMVNTVVNASRLARVPADKVLKDLAESSEEAYKYFRGSPAQLQKTAVQAAKLGTSIKEAADVAGKLLDFENSINSELEASAILGRNLNFGQARYLAANGDILGSQQAILDEVDKLGDLSKMNYYEQEALAKAAGMPIASLKNQQRIRKSMGALGKADLKAAEALIAKGEDLSKLSDEELKGKLANARVDMERTTRMEAMQNKLKGLGLKLASAFIPLANAFMGLLENKDVKKWIDETITGLTNAIKDFDFEKFKNDVKSFFDGVKSGFEDVKAFAKPIVDEIKGWINWLFPPTVDTSGVKGANGELAKTNLTAQSAGSQIVKVGAALLALKVAWPVLMGLGKLLGWVGGKAFSMGTKTSTAAGRSSSSLSKLGTSIGNLGTGIGKFIKGISGGIGGALKALGYGIGGMLQGIAVGLQALANPKAIVGLALITAAFYVFGLALKEMAPALEPLGEMFKSIFEGIATIVVPIVDILVEGFVKLADVIGGVILGIMETFGGIVETVANAFVKIAEVVGGTILGIFDAITTILSTVISNADKAPQVLAMATAVGALGVALAALGGGTALASLGALVGAGFDKLTEWAGGQTPMEQLKELVSMSGGLGQIATTVGPAVTTLATLTSFTSKIEKLVDALNKFKDAMYGVAKAAKSVDTNKIAQVNSLPAGAGGKDKKTLPQILGDLQTALVTLNTEGATNSTKMIEKLEDIRDAVLLARVIEIDGSAVTKVTKQKYDNVLTRFNQYSAMGK